MKLFQEYIRSPSTIEKREKVLNTVEIQKKDDEKQYAFGWAKIAIEGRAKRIEVEEDD